MRRLLLSACLVILGTGVWLPMSRALQQPIAASNPTVPQPQRPPQPPTGFTFTTVVLDPAHGGSDSGARGPSGAIESDLVMDFARATRVALEAQGLRVLLTREGNQGPSLDERSAMINALHDAIFISLHVSSTGPVGTARVYSYASADSAPSSAMQPSAPHPPSTPSASHGGLVEWDKVQEAHTEASRRFAELVQIQLAQKFRGSPEVPSTAAVRQLRSIAAPAITVEISSVALPDVKRLTDMGQPLAEALARAVIDFRRESAGAAAVQGNP